MNAAQRRQNAARLRASGFEDSPALTAQSSDGDIPHGRELSLSWLAGTVLTGLTSVLLMGAALYVAFDGRDTFSTPYRALAIQAPGPTAGTPTDLTSKTDRARPIAQTRSELEVLEASIRELVDGRTVLRNQPFTRIRATLATVATSLSADIPEYDPVAILSATNPIEVGTSTLETNTEIYGSEVEGEVAVRTAALPASYSPAAAISDRAAADFVRMTLELAYSDSGSPALAYAALGSGVRDLEDAPPGTMPGVAENVTVMPKTITADEAGLGRSERIVTIREPTPLAEALRRNGFEDVTVDAVSATLRNVFPAVDLPERTRLRILFGPVQGSDTLVPYRLSIYLHENTTDRDLHAVTVAITDSGRYVIASAPPTIEFPEEDTEEINVANLPTVYRSIWETGRKHDLDDDTIRRIIGMFAYDIDMTRRISAGDSIEILRSGTAGGPQDLLYVSLTLSGTERQLYRFVTPDGVADFYDPAGETGKRFLVRRPLEGGGILRSRFGYRIHPIFGSRRLHTGVDLAARTGTPIYAGGDGTIQFSGWQTGYGNKVEIEHVNGFETGYAHMSRIAEGIRPGVRVRQGQVIGYVGSTGYSTGPHLHYEIKINGNLVDPLSVRLPRENSLPEQYRDQFDQVIAQVEDLMNRSVGTTTVAQAPTP